MSASFLPYVIGGPHGGSPYPFLSDLSSLGWRQTGHQKYRIMGDTASSWSTIAGMLEESATMAETLYLKQMECGPMQNYVYLIGDPATRQAAVVDPAWDVERIVQAAQQDG